MNKKMILIPTAAVSAALAFGSIAYACTAVQGTISATFAGNSGACTSDAIPQPNTSGYCDADISTTAGRAVTVTATGARPNTAFYLWFLNNAARDRDLMNICMSDALDSKHPHKKTWTSTGSEAGTVSSDSSGNIASTTRYIPATVTHGLLFPEQPTHGTHNSTGSICFMDQNIDYATGDVTFVITGGQTTGS